MPAIRIYLTWWVYDVSLCPRKHGPTDAMVCTWKSEVHLGYTSPYTLIKSLLLHGVTSGQRLECLGRAPVSVSNTGRKPWITDAGDYTWLSRVLRIWTQVLTLHCT